MRKIIVAASQMSCSWDPEKNIEKAEKLILNAVEKGGNIILLQELFSTVYFPQEYNYDYFKYAKPLAGHPMIARMQELAKQNDVVLPISFFEKSNEMYYNSVAIIDADGKILGIYRKTHIPDDPGYFEKFYFSPGDTGFKVWNTKYGKIGVGICWDQWFPEAARCMALEGAEMLFYPTAIGTDPVISKEKLVNAKVIKRRWQNAMIGQSIDNMIPVIASNRVGIEDVGKTSMRFFGSSFITNNVGEIIAEGDQYEEGTITATIDLDEIEKTKSLRFRDRRPEFYKSLLTKDGETLTV